MVQGVLGIFGNLHSIGMRPALEALSLSITVRCRPKAKSLHLRARKTFGIESVEGTLSLKSTAAESDRPFTIYCV